MKGLTTHVLDTMRGTGAAGMRVTVGKVEVVLDTQGRATLLEECPAGVYEILFHAGAYLGGAVFYDIIPVRFTAEGAAHVHVPLILSAFGYTTYRGG